MQVAVLIQVDGTAADQKQRKVSETAPLHQA